MSSLELFLLALGLSMDCFAVAVSISACRPPSWRKVLLMAALFGVFQGIMPAIGWFAGNSLKEFISPIDHWIAVLLLAFIGGKMIVESFHHSARAAVQVLNIRTLLALSVATSIDAMITGVSFGFINVNIIKASLIIISVTFVVTLTGSKLGEMFSFLSPRWAERTGGMVLILLGVKILLDHLGML